VSGAVINEIETKADTKDTLKKVEDVINTQRDKQQTAEDYFESLKSTDKEDGRPPSYEDVFGSVEYKSQEEADRIQQIKEQYEKGLTLKNQKQRENKARKQLEELGKMSARLEEMSNIQEDLLKQAEKMNKRLIEESKKQQEPEPEPEPEQKKERKKREPKTKLERDLTKFEKEQKGKMSDLERESVENVVLDARDAERRFNENMNMIRQSRQEDNSTPSDENMSSRVQSFKRGHITPMLARYI
jgi:hypothetical protein